MNVNENNSIIITQIGNIIEQKHKPGGVIAVIGMDSKELVEQAIYNHTSHWQVIGSFNHVRNISSEILAIMLKYHKESHVYSRHYKDWSYSGAKTLYYKICKDISEITPEEICFSIDFGKKVKSIWKMLWTLHTDKLDFIDGEKFIIHVEVSTDDFSTLFFRKLNEVINPEYVTVIVTCKVTREYNNLKICQMDAENWTPADFYGHFCNGRVFYTETEYYNNHGSTDENTKIEKNQSSSNRGLAQDTSQFKRFDGAIRRNPIKRKK